jgi:glycosyltransferase involved in cell wall biosynthesis
MIDSKARSMVLMKISVALCTYNGVKYIEEQLNSILEQTKLPDEIVVCDDCSTDNTVPVIRRALESYTGKLLLVTNPQNIGYKKNFAQSISLCSGDIVFLSDQDDVWAKNKIAVVNSAFQNNPRAVLVFHDAILVDKQLKLLYKSFWQTLEFEPRKFLCHDYNILLEKNVVQGSACAFRKKVFYKALPFPIEAIHDEWLALTAVAEGEIVPIAQPLMKYRQSSDNALGGLPISFIDKIKSWTTNIKNAVDYHFGELLRRAAFYDVYSKKNYNDSELVKKLDFLSYDNFLKKRVFCIENRDSYIIMLFPTYLRLYIYKRNAIKMFLRDLLAMYFCKGKTL